MVGRVAVDAHWASKESVAYHWLTFLDRSHRQYAAAHSMREHLFALSPSLASLSRSQVARIVIGDKNISSKKSLGRWLLIERSIEGI